MERTDCLQPLVVKSAGPERTEALGRALGELARRGLYIALCGELGGGKTTFVRGLARGLGVNDNVASPTFVLMREYQGRVTLYHADFYRLGGERDLVGLELEQCLLNGVLAAEWADKFAAPPGAPVLVLRFEWIGDNERTMEISCGNKAAAEVFEKFAAAATAITASKIQA